MILQMQSSMIDRPEYLADYRKPPLDEVALAVQFDELSDLTSVHIGKIYASFVDKYEVVEERAPIQAKFETFGSNVMPGLEIKTSFGNIPPLRRVWFISKDGHDLVQLQPNRFIHNWRKVKGAGTYRRFEQILPDYMAEFNRFKSALAELDLPTPEINQCEVSYFNNIYLEDNESHWNGFERVFANMQSCPLRLTREDVILEPESPSFNISMRLLDGATREPFARLHVAAEAATDDDERKLIRLTLIVRGRPVGNGDESIEKFMCQGRDTIVESFTGLTTKAAQASWDRIK